MSLFSIGCRKRVCYYSYVKVQKSSLSLPSSWVTGTLRSSAPVISPSYSYCPGFSFRLLYHKLDIIFVFYTVNVYLDLINFYHIFASYSFLHFSSFRDNFSFAWNEFFGISIKESFLLVNLLCVKMCFALCLKDSFLGMEFCYFPCFLPSFRVTAQKSAI